MIPQGAILSTLTHLKIVMRCAIWYHLYNLKNVKTTHGGVLILVKLQAETIILKFIVATAQIIKSNNLPCSKSFIIESILFLSSFHSRRDCHILSIEYTHKGSNCWALFGYMINYESSHSRYSYGTLRLQTFIKFLSIY